MKKEKRTAPTREENKKHFIEYFLKTFKEENDGLLKYVIDASWGNGYNLVLDACWEVLSKDDYWKVVNKLEEFEKESIEDEV